MRKLFTTICGTIIFVSAIIAYLYLSANRVVTCKTCSKFIIHEQDTDEVIARNLVKHGFASNIFVSRFALYFVKHRGHTMKAGEYKIEKQHSLFQILNKFNRHDIIIHNIIIYRSWNVDDIKKCINDRTDLYGEITCDIRDGDILSGKYEFTYPTTKNDLVKWMKEYAAECIAEEWRNRSESCVLKTPNEAVVLASIISKEAVLNDDVLLVASVFSNRLRIGMRLQSDPTVFYAMRNSNASMPFREFMKLDNPYNTYRNQFLPPAPIATPSIDDIRAVLHPIKSDYLYFISDGIQSKLYFSKTHDEHLVLKQKFKRILKTK